MPSQIHPSVSAPIKSTVCTLPTALSSAASRTPNLYIAAPGRRKLNRNPASSSTTRASSAAAEPGGAAAAEHSSGGPGGPSRWSWQSWRRRESISDRVMSGIVNSGSAPIGSYLTEPITVLHRLDPRVKQLWLLLLVLLPARASLPLRLLLCGWLVALTIVTLPRPIARTQLLRSSLFCAFLFFGLAFGTDGVPAFVQQRSMPFAVEPIGLPASSALFTSSAAATAAAAAAAASTTATAISATAPAASVAPLLPSSYRYVVLQLGPFLLTRKGINLAAMATSLSFIILHSAALSLTTTSPEAMTGALRWFMRPMASWKLPVDSAILTLLLSLRFLGLVFDEVRNLALGVVARGIHWNKMQPLGTLDLVLSLAGRLFQNLFSHADQISQAMIARGYLGDPSQHQLYFLGDFRIGLLDAAALLLLAAWIAAAAYYGLLSPI